MVSDSRDHLLAWVRSVADVPVSFARPSPDPVEDSAVNLYMLEVRGRLAHSPTRPDRRQLELGYLVTTASPEPADAQQLLIDLCFAAMEQPGIEIDLEPPDLRLWHALGLPPQPSFRVKLPLRRPRPAPEVKPVLEPLIIQPAALASISGVVRTPEQVAVPEARVEIPLLGRAATTDRAGTFRLDGIPDDGRTLRVRVRARGREVTHEIGGRDDRSFVVITLNPAEAVHG